MPSPPLVPLFLHFPLSPLLPLYSSNDFPFRNSENHVNNTIPMQLSQAAFPTNQPPTPTDHLHLSSSPSPRLLLSSCSCYKLRQSMGGRTSIRPRPTKRHRPSVTTQPPPLSDTRPTNSSKQQVTVLYATTSCLYVAVEATAVAGVSE